jgi:hypothetical protein
MWLCPIIASVTGKQQDRLSESFVGKWLFSICFSVKSGGIHKTGISEVP